MKWQHVVLVYNRPNFSAKLIYVDKYILILKIRIASYEPWNAAYLDSVWYHH